MKIICRSNLSNEKLELVGTIDSMLQITDALAYVVFDDNDYEFDLSVARYYKNPAFYSNIKTSGVVWPSPQHLNEIMYRDDCEYYIWVSKRICESEDRHFAKVYAHEANHLAQDLKFPHLEKVSTFIERALPTVEPALRTQLEFPTELDSEIVSLEIVQQLFGEEAFQEYIELQKKESNGEQYFRRLEELKRENTTSLEHQIITLLKKHKEAFIEQQKILVDRGIDFDFDVDKLCSDYDSNNT